MGPQGFPTKEFWVWGMLLSAHSLPIPLPGAAGPCLLLSASYSAGEVEAERTTGLGLLTAKEPKGEHCLAMASGFLPLTPTI